MDDRERAQEILAALPFSKAQRAFYEAGLAKMSDDDIAANVRRLNAALEAAPQTLEAARQLLKELQQPRAPGP